MGSLKFKSVHSLEWAYARGLAYEQRGLIRGVIHLLRNRWIICGEGAYKYIALYIILSRDYMVSFDWTKSSAVLRYPRANFKLLLRWFFVEREKAVGDIKTESRGDNLT